MRIVVAVPARPGSTSGNSVTGRRWVRRLGELGHAASLAEVADGGLLAPADLAGVDLAVVLHATRCAAVAEQVSTARLPLIVGLAGTDLYRDLPGDRRAQRSIDLADQVVVLQSDGRRRLADVHVDGLAKCSVVHQSVEPEEVHTRARFGDRTLRIAVLAHLRDVKDPLLTAEALRLVPRSLDVTIDHAGQAHTGTWRRAAERAADDDERYRWLGPLERDDATELLARSDVLACTSRLEGGANAVTEALAHGVAVIGTDIGGNRGLVGAHHPGLVPVGDADALAELIARLADRSTGLLDTLTLRSGERRWVTEPERERSEWRAALDAALR